ncbi:MAG: Ig-like domain-containing protein [Verrucomicrobiales bacterium]
MKRRSHLQPTGLAVAIVGVFLGRGAQAETIMDFDIRPEGLTNNTVLPATFGDDASDPSDGISLDGFGTPNIGLTWQATGAQWQYYLDGVWSAVQLDSSGIDDTHELVFTPNSLSARVIIKSFNFHPYYVSSERYTYSVRVLAGETVVGAPQVISFGSDATKEHPVLVNHTGAPGQTLKLAITRVASTLAEGEIEGSTQNIAIDDIVFAQDPPQLLPIGPQVVTVSPADAERGAAGIRLYQATIADAATSVATGSVRLSLDGVPVSPPPTVTSNGGSTRVDFQAPGLLAPGSTHSYSLTYDDTGNPPSTYAHTVTFTVTQYLTLPPAFGLPVDSGSGEGFTVRTVLASGASFLPNTLARAKEQLAGTLINPDTQEPFENGAETGPNADGSYDVETVLDFDDDGAVSGHFTQESLFPGLLNPGNNWFSTHAGFYLSLPAGYHRFGVNSDDGFEVSTQDTDPGGQAAPLVLGLYDDGRPAADTLFDFLVETAGVYRFDLVMFEGEGAASCEFYSVDLASGRRILINDSEDPAAILSYRTVAMTPPPVVTRAESVGGDLLVEWIDGLPPFQVQTSPSLATGTWTNLGAPSNTRSARIPIQSGSTVFVRIAGQ